MEEFNENDRIVVNGRGTAAGHIGRTGKVLRKSKAMTGGYMVRLDEGFSILLMWWEMDKAN